MLVADALLSQDELVLGPLDVGELEVVSEKDEKVSALKCL